MKVEFEGIADNDEDTLTFYFGITTRELNVKIMIYEPRFFDSTVWRRFLNNLVSEKKDILDFSHSNGNVFISSNEGLTTFKVVKYGSSGDGGIEVTVPNKICIHAFTQAFKRIVLIEKAIKFCKDHSTTFVDE